MDDKPIIKVENFTATYGDNIIIDDISFEVNEGEVFIILGVQAVEKVPCLSI